MKRIEFYKTTQGASPVEEFLDSLDDNQTKKGAVGVTLDSGTAASASELFLQDGQYG